MKLKEERGGQLAMVCKIVRSFIFEKLKLLSAFSLTFGDFVFFKIFTDYIVINRDYFIKGVNFRRRALLLNFA